MNTDKEYTEAYRMESTDAMVKEITGQLIFDGQLAVVRGFIFAITSLFSWFVLLFFRRSFGSNAFSLWWLFWGAIFLSLFGIFDAAVSQIPFMHIGIETLWFDWHRRLFILAGLVHFGSILYYVGYKKVKRFSWSYGRSILFPIWSGIGKHIPDWVFKKPLPAYLANQLFYNEGKFQMIVEPAIIMFIGIYLRGATTIFYGNFVIFCGICVAAVGWRQYKAGKNHLQNLEDAEILHAALQENLKGNTDQNHQGFIPSFSIVRVARDKKKPKPSTQSPPSRPSMVVMPKEEKPKEN